MENNLTEESHPVTFDDYIFRKQLLLYLMILKIPPKLDGFNYIKFGVYKIYNDFSKKYNVNNILYPEIAKKFNVSKLLIDRSIRHAIKVSYDRGGITDLEKYSNYEFLRDKPSPKELLCMLAELIKFEKEKFVNAFDIKQNKSILKHQIENPILKYTEFLQKNDKSNN